MVRCLNKFTFGKIQQFDMRMRMDLEIIEQKQSCVISFALYMFNKFTPFLDGEIQTASFQPWAMDELLSDVVDPSSLLFSSTADAMVTCVLRCSQESGCALAGFSATLGICDLYSVYPDLEKALPQASTQFYRLRMSK